MLSPWRREEEEVKVKMNHKGIGDELWAYGLNRVKRQGKAETKEESQMDSVPAIVYLNGDVSPPLPLPPDFSKAFGVSTEG